MPRLPDLRKTPIEWYVEGAYANPLPLPPHAKFDGQPPAGLKKAAAPNLKNTSASGPSETANCWFSV